MKFEISASPAFEPISLEEARDHLRVDAQDEDSLISSLISACRRKVEAETGRALVSQEVRAYWDTFPSDSDTLCLPVCPAQSLSNVMYADSAGAYQVWSATEYTADLVGSTPRIVKKNDAAWPEPGTFPNAVRITYTAGAATTSAVPAELKHAILTQIALLYERREDMPLNGNTPGVRTAAWLQFNQRTNLI